MASQSEVSTRLSADNSQYRSVMNQSERVAENTGKAIFKKLDIRSSVGAVAAAIGFNITNIAESLARFVTGLSKEEEKRLEDLVEKTGKAAEKQEQLLEKARERAAKKRQDDAEMIMAQMKLVSDARQEAIKNEVEAEKRLRQSVYDAQQKAASDHLETVRDNIELLGLEAKAKRGLSKEEADRLRVLREQTKEVERQQEITTLLSLDKRTPEEDSRLQILLKQSKAYKDQLGTVKEITAETKKQGEEILSNIAKWEGFTTKVTSSGRGDAALSDKELERKINNIEQAIFASEVNRVSRIGVGNERGEDPFGFINSSNLSGARSELDFRKRVRMEAGRFGEEYAFQKNPGLTEQRLREILNGQDKSANGRIATSLEKLEKQFQQGIPTVIFGSE